MKELLEVLFSLDWANYVCERMNQEGEVREAAKGWDWDIALVAKGVPGLRDGLAVLKVAIKDGMCVGVKLLESIKEVDNVPFVIEGNYEDWVNVLIGNEDPVAALLRGKLKLVRGNILQLMRRARAALAVANAIRKITKEMNMNINY